jgi:PAS domain S-box-containing protein
LQAEVEARLRFEMLLADICAQFVNGAPSDLDSKIENAQRVICESLRVDHSSVWQVSKENPDLLVMTHVYRDPNLKPLPLHPSVKEYFPWSSNRILNKEIVCVPDTATLPPEATKDKESWEQYGIHSSLVFPLSVAGNGLLIGVLAFDNTEAHDWSEPLQRRLQILAHVFAQALERKRVEQKVRESESRFRLLADTAPVLIWQSGTDKLCTYFNKPWLDFTGRSLEQELGNGCAEGVHPEDFQRCLDTYTQSFDRREKFRMEYRLRRHDGEFRWILDVGVPRFNEDGSFAGYIGIGVDVNEHKRAEDRLREGEARYEQLAEQSRTTNWEVDLQGLFTYVSHVSQASWGYRPDEVVGRMHFYDIHPEEGREAFKAAVFAAVERKQSFRDVVHAVERKDGGIAWGSVNGIPILNADGTLRGYRGSCTDITERKQAEEALRKTEERFRLAAQAGKMYAYEWDVATDLVVRSEEQANVLGFSQPTQLTRQELLARVHPEDRALFVASVDQLTPQYPTTHTSYRVLCPDGSIVWLEKNARGFFDEQGKLLRVIGMVANITERKRVEEALRESEERFRLVANNAPVMIWMSGLDKKPTYFNQLWLDFTGLSETDLRNGLAGIVHPEDYLQCHDDYYRGFDQQQSFRKECRLRRHDGQYRWMLDVGVPRFHKDGSFAGYIGSCIDVTDHKLAEAALANVSGKLIEAQEQERTRIGRELHDDIGQRLAMVAVQLQQFHDDSLVLPEVRNRLGELKKEISGIANDIQSLSHELHSAKLQYLGIAAAMKGFCRDFGDQQKVEVDFQTHDLPSPVPPDTALCLFRVLQEALHNSVKHSGVRHIEVRLWGTSCETHLTVKDSGAGFDREAAKESRGLGLISMEERLKLVKGTLSIESQLKRGTTIHACVPFSLSSDSMRATG